MIHVDIEAAAVAAQLLPAPVLRVVGRAARAVPHLVAARGAHEPHPVAAAIRVRRVDLPEQCPRCLAAGAARALETEDEVAELDVRPAELRDAVAVTITPHDDTGAGAPPCAPRARRSRRRRPAAGRAGGRGGS